MTEFRNVQADLWHFRLRTLAFAVVVILAFGLLAARLFVLQVVRHDAFDEQAESNRTAVVPIVPNRGIITDRNGVVLATNYSAYTLEITPSKVEDLESTIDQLATIVTIQPKDRHRFKRLREESKSFESLPIRTRLTDEEVARFAAQRFRFPGVDIKARLFRNYPYGELASHVIGYIGRINAKEKEAIEDGDDAENYRGTDYIGKLGIEQSYESQLHGTTGVDVVETSAGGRATRKLYSTPATPGQAVVLSIDIKLQKLIEDLYGDRRGALVALDPKTGEVLAFVSKPTFDPNLFVDGIDQENWQALNESIDKPLLNRALRGTYPPGSTYKPFMALAALETGSRSAKTIVNDPGFYMFGGHRFGSPENERGGLMDMHRAIAESSNVYFYSLANEMGAEKIHDFMEPLGLGQISGIDIKGEVRGVLPNQAWKRSYFKRPEQQKWYAGETISLGIGQGYNSFTVLQIARALATVVVGGQRPVPHLVLATRDPVTRVQVPQPVTPPVPLGFQPENIEVIRKAMIGVTQEGTSTKVFAGAAYLSGGKTGTAQAVSLNKNEKYNAAKMEEHQRDHSWYVAFAPADDPKIVLAAIVENAGFGAAHAAPIARRVFDYWLSGVYPSEEDMAATRLGQTAAPIGKPRPVAEYDILRGAATSAILPTGPASAPAASASAAASAPVAAASAASAPASGAASRVAPASVPAAPVRPPAARGHAPARTAH